VIQILRYNESGVEYHLLPTIAAPAHIVVMDDVGVNRHRNRRLGRDVPPVHEPLERQFEVLDGGVGVHEDDEFVFFEHAGEDVRPDP
jgi:hypothetical protein